MSTPYDAEWLEFDDDTRPSRLRINPEPLTVDEIRHRALRLEWEPPTETESWSYEWLSDFGIAVYKLANQYEALLADCNRRNRPEGE